MIRVYFDWNVISQMKHDGHLEIKDIIDRSENLLIFYSTAHIGDIFSSYSNDENQLEIIDKDLNFLSILTKDNCLSISDDNLLNVNKTDPKELFEQRVYTHTAAEINSLDTLFKSLDDSGLGDLGQLYIDIIKNTPLGEEFVKTLSDPESAELLNTFLPGIKENPTMDGMFSGFMAMKNNINNGLGYDELRKIYQKALQINPDQAFNWKDPFKEHEKILKSIFKNNLNEFNDVVKKEDGKYAPSWYNEIVRTYINLDMSGFKQDKIEIKKGKKSTFKNTTEDAFHVAFSTVCDIFVVNDKRSHSKAKEVFNKLNINTIVLNSEEFVEYYNTFLSITQGYGAISLICEYIRHAEPYISENDQYITMSYITKLYFFDFFNIIYLIKDLDNKEDILFLSKEKPTNGRFTLFEEVESLVNRLIIYFGSDIENMGELSMTEFKNLDVWTGRKWQLSGLILKLTQINGFFQLYFLVDKQN